MVELTSSCLGQLRQPQHSIVTRHRLKRDIRVPLRALGLLLSAVVLCVQFLGLHRRDDADLIVLVLRATGVHDGVNVQLGGFGFARELAEALDEFLLQVIGHVVLLSEEDDAALGYFHYLLDDVLG